MSPIATWFSYPGYSELLVGRAQDDVIKSNDPTQNPNRTVLEFLQSSQRVVERAGGGVRVMAGASRDRRAHRQARLTVNAGDREIRFTGSPSVRRDSELQFETPTPWGDIRYDAYTARFAMDHLARHRPRVLHLALDETDDWAHDWPLRSRPRGVHAAPIGS